MYPNRVFLALGSNIGNWKVNFNNCLKELHKVGNLIAIGNIYISEPYGYKEQNNFYNTALELKTSLNPIELIYKIQLIEKKLHKKKIIENGPRRIDIDIIFFNSLKITNNNLIIPHPRATDRDFVIYPLDDIDPFFKHPVQNKTKKQLKIELTKKYINKKIKQPKDLFVIH